MERVILIKYGELSTKKDNRKLFINTLYNNLMSKLKNIDLTIEKNMVRMFIHFKNEKDQETILNVVKNTFGIHAYNLSYKVNTNIDDIKEEVLKILKEKKFNIFKVETKRSYKQFCFNSIEVNDEIGALVLKNFNCKVDVHHPELKITIEIRKDFTYISLNEEKGLGGYPVGVQGHGLLMLSGGIDSPVAGYLALKRGIKIDAIYFEAIPHTSLDARNKVIKLAHKLLKYTSSINLYIVSITELQEEIYKVCDPNYIITILRRMMYRISEKVANDKKDLILINGESIGQVASQTLTSMNVINRVVNIPVVRPLACFDKLEIIDIANKIDTYETSILPYEDCCTIFVPKHPIINPKESKCLEEENKILYQNHILKCIDSITRVEITNKKEYNNLL